MAAYNQNAESENPTSSLSLSLSAAGSDQQQLTEEEASRYDRQMRLWGLEAQQRMRNATIVVVRLKGTAAETVKNVVLAGVGKVVMVDGEEVMEEDLGAGFLFRDEDVGRNRVEAAKSRVESLNPLVTVEAISDASVLVGEKFEDLVRRVDIVCVTDWDRDGLIRMNEVCRKNGKLFYSGGTYGLLGYIFCDLLDHDYIAPDRSGLKDAPKNVKKTEHYSSLEVALRHRWTSLTKRQTKEVNPAVVFSVLAIWQYQSLHAGQLPNDTSAATELQSIANSLITEADVNKQVLTQAPETLLETMSTTAAHEFSPVCAIVGGMLGQDILKTLAAREPPIANFFVFDGHTGAGTVTRMSMP